jgi:hypothetical protein
VGLTRGLVRIEPPHGTFVVFSAGAGQSALDRLSNGDPDPNSVFTRVFAASLRADLTLQEAMKATQEKVVALARSIQVEQNPAYYDEVIGSACLSASCITAGAPAASRAGDEPITADYQAAAAVGTAAGWDLFLKKYGAETDNFYVGLAKESLQKLAVSTPPDEHPSPQSAPKPGLPQPSTAEAPFWALIQEAFSKADLLEYLARFPNGEHADVVRSRLKQFGPAPLAPENPNHVNEATTEAALWASIQEAFSKADLLAYLAKFPDGAHASIVRSRLKQFGSQQDQSLPFASRKSASQH